MHNKDEENLQNRTDKGSKGVVEPPVKAEALQFFEEGVVLKGDRVGRDVLLHPVLPRFVRVPLCYVMLCYDYGLQSEDSFKFEDTNVKSG